MLTALFSSSARADSDGHKLDALWKQYEAARKQDLPQKEQNILTQIKDEAVRQRLAWDFYDAVTRYEDTGTRINWKLRDTLRSVTLKAIEEYNEPIVTFYYQTHEVYDLQEGFLKANEQALKASNNPEFHKRDWSVVNQPYKQVLLENFTNDYEFVAWNRFISEKDKTAESVFKGRYPMEALVEFENLQNEYSYWDREINGRTEELEAFTDKYRDKGVSLLSRQELLTDKFRQLNSEKAAGKDYEELRELCQTFEKDRKASPEKAMAESCTEIAALLKTMESKELSFSILDDILTVKVRNIGKVEVEIKADKKSVFKEALTNPVGSFYAQDTIVCNLQSIPDGSYKIICKGEGEDVSSQWEKYTLSMALKYDASGWWSYAADYQTGEPVADYEKGFRKITGQKKTFQASVSGPNGPRLSNEAKLNAPNIGPFSTPKNLQAVLLTDRTAFNPEETVQFKAILYRRDYSLEAVGAGKKVTFSLLDPKGDEVRSSVLKTNAFGSVAGSFIIPRAERNGTYTLRATVDGKIVAVKSLTVDDFVLPSFNLEFDRHDPVKAGEKVVFSGLLRAYSGHSLAGAEVTYRLSKWHSTVDEGPLKLQSDGRFEVSFDSEPEGYQSYNITVKVVDATGETNEFSNWARVYWHGREEEEKPREYSFDNLSDETHISIRAIAGKKPVWALVELYGLDSKLIDSHLEYFEPKGEAPAEQIFSYEYKAEYPDAITLNVLYFQNSKVYLHSETIRRKDTRYDLPLKFTRFLDTTVPGSSYEFLIATAPGVECAATIFDKSSERISSNEWWLIRPEPYPQRNWYYNNYCGSNHGYGWYGGNRLYMMKSAGAVMMDMVATEESEKDEIVEEFGVFQLADPSLRNTSYDDVESVTVREDFSTTIAWEPFLRSDKKGNISFKFTNSDKLSTFYVQLFAHDKAMKNATLRQEMVVTIPVKISVLDARYLYPEDRWNIRVSLSSILDHDITGTLNVAGTKVEVSVPAMSQAAFELPVVFSPKARKLEFTAAFIPAESDQAGDAVKVKVPIRESYQTITEAHSDVLLAGADKQALIAELREQFVNIPGSEASVREISIKQMLQEALPEYFNTDSENSITLIRTLYAATLAKNLGSKGLSDEELAEVVKRLTDCHKPDGGFAWFSEFESSPIITATILDFCAGLSSRALDIPAELAETLPAAVNYLDKKYFAKEEHPLWRGGLSMEQYLYVRSLYPAVKFTEKPDSKWSKEARKYLVPTGDRGLQYSVFAKARRMKTLQALQASEDGLSLARKLGVSLGTKSRLRKSLEADTRSLVQYAVRHRSGAVYYPNAVMPWRGLLESELYAHSLICDLLASRGENELAEGIRLWLMLQKETQQWGADPGTVNALASVRDASPATLETRVVALSGSARLPFAQIQAAGNGFTIEREWYKVDKNGGRTALKKGDTIEVGDKVVAVAKIWNEENRSFIHITIPRPACLTPQNQLSGYFGWNAWRSVGIDRTEYWFETYPEEKTAVEETFFVSQSGRFHSGVPEIESLYAPHYRANGTSGIEIVTKSR